MIFEQATGRSDALYRVIVIYVIILVVLATAAGRFAQSPREWTLFSIAALIVFLIIWRSLRRFASVNRSATQESAFGLPLDVVNLQDKLLELDMRLDHAPIALWQCRSRIVEPLNNAARRLLAPGRAIARNELFTKLAAASTGSRTIIGFESERGFERALITCSSVLTSNGEVQLLALLPIESELESETLLAWRQLVHVLTHEIMNSLTPISSLSRTAHEMYLESLTVKTSGDGDNQSAAELLLALEAIARRSAHLITFVDRYRSISELPAAQLSPVPIANLFERVEKLVHSNWSERGGTIRFKVDPSTMELLCDAGQLEQVLLNLIRNAREATEGITEPFVEIQAQLVRGGRLTIRVSDNGPGVVSGTESAIFTPFYSTRENGSGIGLAVVRSLIHGMGGTVRYAKMTTGGACFVITF